MTTIVTISTTEGDSKNVSTITVTDKALAHVLRSFNPSGDQNVDDVKVLCGAVVQKMHELQMSADKAPGSPRGAAIAITQIEFAQMAAVKAYFAKF